MLRLFSFLLALLLPLSAVSQVCGTNMFQYRQTYANGNSCTGVGATALAAWYDAMKDGKCHGDAVLPSYSGYVSAAAAGCSPSMCSAYLTHAFGGTTNVTINYQSGAVSTVNVPCPDACASLTGTPLSASDISVPVTGPHVTPQTICETVSNTGGPNGGPLLCTMSYTTKPDGMWAQSPSGQWHFFVYSATQAANYKHTGTSCVGSTTGGSGSGTAPAPNDTTCPTGKCPGVVNGTNVCVPCSGTATNDSKETTVEKDSTGATTDTETKDTSVTCQGNYCTINTQTTNASGGTTSNSKTVDKGTFCEENPTHPACTSRWQDEACDKEQTCEGDPIACAQAKLAKKTYCENFVNKTPLSELGEEAANGEATPDGHPRNDAQVSAFNFGAAFSTGGGGGCPSDVSVRGVMVPLSSLCDGLNALGIAALGIALIWAARVVFGE